MSRSRWRRRPQSQSSTSLAELVLFFTLNREDFSFVIHLDRQPRTSRRREAQTGSRARSGSRSERTLDAVEHSRTLMEWWPFLIFHRGGLRIKVINNKRLIAESCRKQDIEPDQLTLHADRGSSMRSKPDGFCSTGDELGSPAPWLTSEVLPPSSVGEMTLRLYGALSYSQNSARDLCCALNGA